MPACDLGDAPAAAPLAHQHRDRREGEEHPHRKLDDDRGVSESMCSTSPIDHRKVGIRMIAPEAMNRISPR